MTEDKDAIEARTRQDAEQVATRLREDAEWTATRLREDPSQVREWLRQNNLIYGGLIGVGVIFVQPFLTAPSLDQAATISVVAFALAIPLLAALIMLNEEEVFRQRPARSRFVVLAKAAAQLLSVVGVVAAFWHVLWIAGVAIVAAVVVALAVHSVGYVKLNQADRTA